MSRHNHDEIFTSTAFARLALDITLAYRTNQALPDDLFVLDPETGAYDMSECVFNIWAYLRDVEVDLNAPEWMDASPFQLARDAREYLRLKNQYSHFKRRHRLKPGPTPRTLEEATKIVEDWREYRRLGYFQRDFADANFQGSRKVLSSCIRQCRDAYGADFI